MIDKTQDHSYQYHNDTKVVIYLGKYDFTAAQDLIYDIKNGNSKYSFTKEELLMASIVATQFNETYVKSSGSFDIVMGDFVRTRYSNKEIMVSILINYPHLITNADKTKASEIMRYLEGEFSFKILSGNLTDFESSIAQFLAEDSDPTSAVLGVAAYIPTYYDTAVKNDELRDRSNNDTFLGAIGEKVQTEIEILRTKYLAETNFGGTGYMVSGITTDNHRVSFFTSNEEIANSTKNIKIQCKVKAHGKAFKEDFVNETRVNYVKFC